MAKELAQRTPGGDDHGRGKYLLQGILYWPQLFSRRSLRPGGHEGNSQHRNTPSDFGLSPEGAVKVRG